MSCAFTTVHRSIGIVRIKSVLSLPTVRMTLAYKLASVLI